MNDQLTLTFSAESGDLPSPLKGSVGEQNYSSKKTNTAKSSCENIGQKSRSYPTSRNLTQEDTGGCHLLPEVFHANLFQSETKLGDEGRTMTVTSGRRCSGLLKNQNRTSSWQKTLLESSKWHSTKCLLTWIPLATPQGHLLFQLAASTRPIEEIGCGLWPTPTSRDHKDCGDSVANGNVEVKSLLGRAVGPSKEHGSLNPTFVEWLMGYPKGWTDLQHSETQ